jgi:hypothetical protein
MGVELSLAIGLAVVVGAYHLLRTLARRQRSTGGAVSASGRDAPAALLAGAVRLLAADRAEWGRAMLRELEQLESSRVRWRFTLGCVAATLRVGRRRGDPGESIILCICEVLKHGNRSPLWFLRLAGEINNARVR